MEILTYKPKYVEFLIEDGDAGRTDRGKFPEWGVCRSVGIAADEETLGGGDRTEGSREEHAYHRERIWILGNFHVISRGDPF